MYNRRSHSFGNHRTPGTGVMSWFFRRVFPVLFIGVFALVVILVLGQVALVGWASYNLLTDPTGTANTVGTVLGEAIRPIVEAVEGE